MPATYLFTAIYSADDVKRDWYYEASTTTQGRGVYFIERFISSGALTGGVLVGSPDPSGRADGSILYGPFCEDTTKVTITYVADDQSAALEAEENAAECTVTVTCDLTLQTTVQGRTLLINSLTSHPPISTRIVDALGNAYPWAQGRLQYDNLPSGTGRVYVKDAGDGTAPCTREVNFVITGSGSGGGGSMPTGQLIDTFTTGGVQYDLYYQTDPVRFISVYTTPPTQTQTPFTEAERGRAEGEVIAAPCEGTTKVTFKASLSYPYATIETEADSLSCGATPVFPCSLSALVEVTPETATGGDGSALVLVGGNQGDVSYSLDDHQTSSQDDPLFAGLLSGDYVATVREKRVNGCVARVAFNIAAPRGLRYVLPFTDVNRVGYEVRFYQRGYTGAAEQLCGSDQPCVLEWQGNPSDGLFDNVVQASNADFNISVQAGNDMRDTFCPDERYMLVQVINLETAVMEWCGWLTPSLYDAEFLAPPYDMTLRATDGLGGLSGIKYGTPNGLLLEGLRSDIDIIRHCLSLLEYRLPMAVAYNLYAEDMPATLADDPLAHVYRFQQGFRTDKGEALTCRAVLEKILRPHGCVLRQEAGEWQVVRQAEIFAATSTERHYDATGVRSDTTPTVRDILRTIKRPNLPGSDLIWIRAQQALTILPAVAGVTLTSDPGQPLNLLVDTAWPESAFTGSHLTRWKGQALVDREEPAKKDAPAGVRFLESNLPPEWIQSPPALIGLQFGQPNPGSTEPSALFGQPTLGFTARYDKNLNIPESDTGDPAFELAYPLIEFSVQVGELWLSSLTSGALQPTPAVFSQRHYPVRGEKAYSFPLFTATSQPVSVRFYELEHLILTNIRLTSGESFSEEHTDTYIADNTSASRITVRDEETFTSGDTRGTVFPHTPVLADGSPTVRWYSLPNTPESGAELLDLQTGLRMLTQARPVQVLTGTLRGTIRRGDVVTDPQETPARLYYQTDHRWDMVTHDHDIRMVELIGGQLPPTEEELQQGLMLYESGDPMRYEDGKNMQYEYGNG